MSATRPYEKSGARPYFIDGIGVVVIHQKSTQKRANSAAGPATSMGSSSICIDDASLSSSDSLLVDVDILFSDTLR